NRVPVPRLGSHRQKQLCVGDSQATPTPSPFAGAAVPGVRTGPRQRKKKNNFKCFLFISFSQQRPGSDAKSINWPIYNVWQLAPNVAKTPISLRFLRSDWRANAISSVIAS